MNMFSNDAHITHNKNKNSFCNNQHYKMNFIENTKTHRGFSFLREMSKNQKNISNKKTNKPSENNNTNVHHSVMRSFSSFTPEHMTAVEFTNKCINFCVMEHAKNKHVS